MGPNRQVLWGLVVVGAGFFQGYVASVREATSGFRPVRVAPSFPPITRFPIRPAREANRLLNPAELVLGVQVGKEARAYPLNMLTGPQREILNDSLGGKAIAATW